MPKITINGVEYEAQPGQTIIEVADEHGVNIPRFCYHPGLTVAGNCRICLVDVEKAPKPQIACGTPVMDGMVVHTDNEQALWARQGVMEFLLLNHPLDCPICDKAGECMLQWFSVEHGPGGSRLADPKEHYEKRLDIGEHILLDQERCILCSRCVRFCDEITKTSELGIFERGVGAELNVIPGNRLDNAYSGCVTDICPVGALTLKEFRFKARVWFLKNTPSICPGCSRGCNIEVAVNANLNPHGGRIERITPRTNIEANDYWMCDIGRLIHQDLYDRPRLLFPQVRNGEGLARATWDAAADAAWTRLGAAADRGGPGAVAVIASAGATNEEMHLLKRLHDQVQGGGIAFPEHRVGEDDGLLLNADRTPNRRGAREICGEASVDGTALAAIRSRLEAGALRGLLVAGESGLAEQGWRAEWLDRLDVLVVLEQFGSAEVLARAQVVLPLAAWAEIEGTYVNFGGRVQRLRPAVRAPGEVRPGWQIVAALGERAGWEERYSSAREVMEEVAETVAAFRGLSYPALGMGGAPLPGTEGVA